MSKLLSRGRVSDAARLASRVRNALVRGAFLFAAVLLFTANDAAAQALPCSIPFENPNTNPNNAQGRVLTDNIGVQRTNFCESAGNISATSGTTGFYIWRRGNNIQNSTPATTWTVTLESGTATKGVDFTDWRGLNPGDPSWITTTNGAGTTTNLSFEILQDTDYEGPETIRVRIQGVTNPGSTVPADVTTPTFDETIELTIVDDDAPPPVADIGGGMHAVARAEALVDNQPRLAPMLRNPGAQASDFSLRASGGGVEAASGGFQAETIWGATSLSRSSDGFGDHEYLLATLGAHFRMSERLHLGGMLQFDRSGSEPGGTGESGEITGNGWMVGPYFAYRDASNPLYFEGRLLYGRSSNKVDDLEVATSQAGGTVNATFDSERWLVQGRVEGTYQLGNGTTLIPLADFSHARDEMEAFQDANVSAQRAGVRAIAVTKLQLGAEFEIPVETASGDLMLKPGLRLVVSDSTGAGAGENSTSPADAAADYRARVDFGVNYRLEDNLVLGFESFYSAHGTSGEDESSIYGAGLNLQFEF